HQQQIKNLIVAIGQIDDHFASGRCQSDEVFMLRWYPATVRHVDLEGTERLRMQKLADFVDPHGHDDTTAGTDDKPCHFRRIYLALVCSNYVACESAVQLAMCARSEHRPDRGNTPGRGVRQGKLRVLREE